MPGDPLLLRQALVAASAALYWGGVLLNIRRIRRRLGKSPNVKPRGLRERVLWLGWSCVIAGWVGQPIVVGSAQASPLFHLIESLEGLGVTVTGILMIFTGHLGTRWCYAALGDAWRIGVDRRERTGLVTHGPYRWVRHPIYVFQIIILSGAMCLLPTPFSLIIIGVHLICVLAKTLDEETHLMRAHGAPYRMYSEQTGRFLPKLRSFRLLFR